MYEPAQERIEQRRRIGGGSTAASSPNKPGTYLVLKTSKRRPPVSDLILRALVGSDDDRGIGLVYRFHNAGTFYFFLMHGAGLPAARARRSTARSRTSRRRRFDGTAGFTVGGTHRLKLVAVGTRHELYVDGELALAGGRRLHLRAGTRGVPLAPEQPVVLLRHRPHGGVAHG